MYTRPRCTHCRIPPWQRNGEESGLATARATPPQPPGPCARPRPTRPPSVLFFFCPQVRANSLQELVYKQGQAGVTKATVSIVFDNTDKANR